MRTTKKDYESQFGIYDSSESIKMKTGSCEVKWPMASCTISLHGAYVKRSTQHTFC